MELNPVKFIHLFMSRVWQEIYSLPIAFSLFLSPHFSRWADLDNVWTQWGWVKLNPSFFIHQKHLFKWPNIFLVGIISCWDGARLTFSPMYFFYFFFSLFKDVFLFIFQKACCFTLLICGFSPQVQSFPEGLDWEHQSRQPRVPAAFK